MLAQALGFDPRLTPGLGAAVLHARPAETGEPAGGSGQTEGRHPEDRQGIASDWSPWDRSRCGVPPSGPASSQEACVLLERLIQAYHGVGAELDELWQALEKGFAPAFAEAPPQVLREILTVVDTCLRAARSTTPAGGAASIRGTGFTSCSRPAAGSSGWPREKRRCTTAGLRTPGTASTEVSNPWPCEGSDERSGRAVAAAGRLRMVPGRVPGAGPGRRCSGEFSIEVDRWVDQIQGGTAASIAGVQHVESDDRGCERAGDALPSVSRV